jgi:hypothetical protein
MGTLSVDKLVKTSAGAAEFTLPATDGTAGQVMQTDGAGQLSIATVGSSGIATDAVTTTEIIDNAVTGAKIAMGSDVQGDVLYYNGTDYVRLGPGTSGQFLQTTGASADPAWATVSSSGFNSVQIFTASGTWTKPTGITKVIIEVQGGGAGGGKRTSTPNTVVGGSAGGYAKKFINVSSVTASVITIGAGGAGATTQAAGADGGDSRWLDTGYGGGSDVTGVKGVGSGATFGTALGGLGTGGDINIQGDVGGSYNFRKGGNSQFGHGGWNGWLGENVATAGIGYGSGGGGGYNIDGKAGAAGIIVVWEYK